MYNSWKKNTHLITASFPENKIFQIKYKKFVSW